MVKKFSVIILILIQSFSLIITGCKTGTNKDETESVKIIKPNRFKKHIDLENSKITYYNNKSEIFEKQTSFIKENDQPFTCIEYGPSNELPVEMKNPEIYILFSQGVVPLAKLGEIMTESSIIQIDPPIKGIYRWYGSRLLTFESKEKTLPQREYKVRINPEITSLGGKPYTGIKEFSFYTEPLDIVDYYPGISSENYSLSDIPLKVAKTITISFSYPVNLNVIKKYLAVTSHGKKYNFDILRIENTDNMDENYINRTVVLHIKEEFEENSLIRLILKKGARSEENYIGRPEDKILELHTIKPFSYLSHRNYSYSFPRSEKQDYNPVYLEFSHPLQAESVNGRISTSLKANNMQDNISIFRNYLKISNLPVTYGESYNININQAIQDIYGRSLSKSYSVTIKVPDATSYYYFPNYGSRMLEASFEPKIIFEHQNIFDGVWRIDSIDDPYSTFPSNTLYDYDFTNAEKNTTHYKIINLNKWLPDEKKGFVGISWNFEPLNKKGIRSKWGQYNLQVQVTDLGVTTRYAYNKIIVMVGSLKTGKPVEDALVSLDLNNSLSILGRTDKNGIVSFPLEQGEYIKLFSTDSSVTKPRIRVEKEKDKVIFIPNGSHDHYHFGIYDNITINKVESNRMKVYLFCDRGLYKPGEMVSFAGVDRNLKIGSYSIYQGPYTLYAQKDYWDAKPFYAEKGSTSEKGSFSGKFQIPENIEPGYYSIVYSRQKQKHQILFQVAHFKRLNFSVQLTKPDITYYIENTISMNLQADYLAGGTLGSADYSYYWTKKSVSFTPPGKKWKGYSFGPKKYEEVIHLASGSGKLNASGNADINHKTIKDTKGETYMYNLEARVTDIDRQMVTARNSVIVHPASFYIGIKIDTGNTDYWSYFVPKGEAMKVDYIMVTPGGKEIIPEDRATLTGRRFIKARHSIMARLFRIDYRVALQKGVYGRMNRRYERIEELEYETEISNNSSSGSLKLTPEKCGSYFIELETTDKTNHPALSRIYFYSTGSSWVHWGFDNPNDIKLVPDNEAYKPKEKVRLLVQSPVPEGMYLLTIEREGILEEKVIKIKGSANVIDIPVKEQYIPIFYIALSTYTKRSDPPPKSYFDPDLGKPKGYFGITPVLVSHESRGIDLKIISDKNTYKPSAQATFTIKAEKNGKPLSGIGITFLAVDRGVLDLIDYHIPDPLGFFYSPDDFPLGVYGADSRSLLIDPVTYEIKDHPGGDGKGLEEKLKFEGVEQNGKNLDMNIRKDFRATAVFRSNLITDESGKVKVSFNFPDTLTTYRITAIASDTSDFGIKEKEVKAQNLLNVKAALNRRLRIRDTSYAGVVITNLDSKNHKIRITAESDLIKIDDKKEKIIQIPSGSSVEVPFKLLATNEGEANIIFTISSKILNEQLIEKIIIEKPIIKETFTVTGKTTSQIDDLAKSRADEGLILPSNIAEGYGGLFLTLDSTRLGSLNESIRYLFSYPYGCTEQRLAKLLPLVLFGDNINLFDLKSEVHDLRKVVEEELAHIAKFQNTDGGIPFWLEGNRPSSPYCSLRFAHIMYIAEKRGFIVPALDKEKLIQFIRDFANNQSYRYLKLYSIYIQALYNRNILSIATKYFSEGDVNGLSGYSLLGLAFLENKIENKATMCLNRIKSFIKVGTQTIDIVEPYETRFYFDSDVQKLALFLMLYNKLNPESDFIEKITRTLMNRQKYGYWLNTSDTGWALQSLDELLEREAGVNTDFIAKVYINSEEVLQNQFSGISKRPYEKYFSFTDKPLLNFKQDVLLPFSFTKEGSGNLYYTASLKYSLPSEVIRGRDEGFSIFTELHTIDGNRISYDNLKLGETYRMHVVISSSKRRNFVVLRVPIPSGGEVLDASFITTGSFSEAGGTDRRNWTIETIYGDEHTYTDYWDYYAPIKRIMDNEVRYIFDDFYRGKQEIEFLFRLTTPGIYPTPPAYVQCMYEEEIFGRSDGIIYIIQEK